MQGIPKSYDDAAVIDGCNKFRIYWNVIMPMCKPSLIVVAFMKFIEQWNNFFSPLIYINSMEKYTLPMGMQVLKGFRSSGSLAHILAGVMISMIVPAIVYIFGQKYLIKGTMLSGIKG
jgi:multiple sugar transport system permease protein